jgi:subtilisin family serine protease
MRNSAYKPMLGCYWLLLSGLVFALLLPQGTSAQQNLPSPVHPGTQTTVLDSLARVWRAEDSISVARALEAARMHGWPTAMDNARLVGLRADGSPLYEMNHNRTAAQTIGTHRLRPGGDLGLDLTGEGMTVGMWELGVPRTTHREFQGRIRIADGSTYTECNTVNYHATHVGGILIAAGLSPEAQGMAPAARMDAYDTNNDSGEMAQAAAAGLLISNHSYGLITGWFFNPNQNRWEWHGNTAVHPRIDYNFGFYDARAQRWDQIAQLSPYYLIVKSAGNDRVDRQPAGDYYVFNNTTRRWEVSREQRNADGPWDCISTYGTAKNILTVGAVSDLPGGWNGPNSVRITDFSSTGPTDDGRVKPDLVANGDGLRSTGCRTDTRLDTESGTSMSSPSLAGSLLLVQQLNARQNGGQYLRSSTLKGLAIHTADEAGEVGPDYVYGWGLANIGRMAEFILNNGTDRHIREETLFNAVPYTLRMQAVGGGEPLKVTICWTDPPGTPHAPALNDRRPKLINDLDLRIRQADSVHRPWVLNPEQPAQPARRGDNVVDNVEQIIIDRADGEYVLTISNKGRLSGQVQEFALIISGASLTAGSCAQFSRLTNSEGSFTDGSPVDAPYAGGSRCCWLIEPNDASRLRLAFARLDLNANRSDSIIIYDGKTTSSPVLAVVSGGSFPDTLVTSGSAALVCFQAGPDNEAEAKGWTINYSPQPFCNARTVVTALAGTLTDGSGPSDYSNNTQCEWLIQPTSAARVRFWMTQLSIENNRDFVRLYDGPTTAAPLLRSFTGTRLTNSDTILSSGPVMLVRFETDEVGRGAGFQARYNTVPVGRGAGQPSYVGLDLHPNPATNATWLSLQLDRPEVATLRIIDATGRTVRERRLNLAGGQQTHELDLQGLASGLYLVELQGSRSGRLKLLIQ